MPWGVTESMIATYGPIVFELGLNIQRRRGDPVRELDFAAITAQRDGTGLTDTEIAHRLGLHVQQVTFIRVVSERRVFRNDQYRKLFGLGAGKRWRPERYRDPDATLRLDADGERLRDALRYPPRLVASLLAAGSWNGETVGALLLRHAASTPDAPAVLDERGPLSWARLAACVGGAQAAWRDGSVSRGRAVALGDDDVRTLMTHYLALAGLGAVAAPLPARDADRRDARSALAAATTLPGRPVDASGPAIDQAAAADPVLLLWNEAASQADGVAAIHTHQSLLCAGRALAGAASIDASARLGVEAPRDHPLFWLVAHAALASGACLVRAADATHRFVTSGRSAAGDAGRLLTWSSDPGARSDANALWGCAEAPLIACGDAGRAVAGMEARRGADGRWQIRGGGVCGGRLGRDPGRVAAFDDDGWWLLATGAR